jgi:hypothetical protein
MYTLFLGKSNILMKQDTGQVRILFNEQLYFIFQPYITYIDNIFVVICVVYFLERGEQPIHGRRLESGQDRDK